MSPDRSRRYTGGWVVGPTLLTGATVAIGLVALAVLSGRTDLLVLALPLVIVSTWAYAGRPTQRSSAVVHLPARSRPEHASTRWSAELVDAAGAEQWHVAFEPTPGVLWDGGRNAASDAVADGTSRIDLTFALERWGPAGLGAAQIVATSPWAGFVWGPARVPGFDMRGTPHAEPFTGRAPVPHPVGLVGANRSARFGDGTEFADIRPFRPGDKLRTVHWPVTTRTGELHVRTSYAEQDAEVVLVLDASVDVGGQGTAPSSLDLGLRACASLSQYFLERGDRVQLDVVGAELFHHVPVSLGNRQLHRILDTLSRVAVGRASGARPERVRIKASYGATVLLVSPLLGDLGFSVAAGLARRGLQVIVVDCMPADLTSPDDDALDLLALRMRMLERDIEVDGLAVHGVPVAPWQGPGSLDAVLRAAARRPAARAGRR